MVLDTIQSSMNFLEGSQRKEKVQALEGQQDKEEAIVVGTADKQSHTSAYTLDTTQRLFEVAWSCADPIVYLLVYLWTTSFLKSNVFFGL